jgi:GNAT superfamily N-acetyltransferase
MTITPAMVEHTTFKSVLRDKDTGVDLDMTLRHNKDYRFRPLTPKDKDIIADQRDRVFLEMGMDPIQVARARKYYIPWLEESLKNEIYRGYAVVDKETGAVVAGAAIWVSIGGPLSMVMSLDLRRATLTNVYVEPSHRRKGLARALVQLLIALCREEGYPLLNLHASDAGRPLYESLGFEDTHESRMILASSPKEEM